jgi:hypothetical protein
MVKIRDSEIFFTPIVCYRTGSLSGEREKHMMKRKLTHMLSDLGSFRKENMEPGGKNLFIIYKY